ncbi:MAG: cysteine--tRNA ligase [Nitrosopumilaceae archaeon]
MKIFDTLSSSEKDLDTLAPIRIYLCGVTVYDESHVGHARTIIVFDTLRRFLESQGNKVKFVQNFTDVDDKIINRAQKEGVSASDISRKYLASYFEDFDKLNIKRGEHLPKATDHIKEMLDLTDSLIKKDYAYVSKNGVYFSVSKFKQYGKLSKKKIEDLISGARVEVDETKNEPLDFALWKFADSDPSWDSPWGRGRPGWHLECSAMSLKFLGENFEIHGGGNDLIFPHHENEIAQSESHTGKPLAKIWMHVGMVTMDGEKMSKSLGNIKSVKNALKDWGPNIIRLFCLSGQYSKPIDYSEKLLKENAARWRQVENCYYELVLAEGTGDISEAQKLVSDTKQEFEDALNNDFNTPLALSAFFKLVKNVNRFVASETLTKSMSKIILSQLEKMLESLGLKVQKMTESEIKSINELINKRESFRRQNQYDEADKIRHQISDLGVTLVDHKGRTTWVKQERIGYEG